jgi:glutamate carboxypeptidase
MQTENARVATVPDAHGIEGARRHLWRCSLFWQGDRVHGQGVSEVKDGNVIELEAVRAMQRVGEPIAVARADMVELARLSDVALAFEGAAPKATAPPQPSAAARRAVGAYK